MPASLRRASLAASCICLCLLVSEDTHRRAHGQAEVAAFNYSTCDTESTTQCTQCLSCMLNYPGFQYCGTGWICGGFQSSNTIYNWACQQSGLASAECQDGGYVIYQCTGGTFYVCGCACLDPNTGNVDCTGNGNCSSTGNCSSVFCNGSMNVPNVTYNMGQTCTNL
jgi:hypothetical protein